MKYIKLNITAFVFSSLLFSGCSQNIQVAPTISQNDYEKYPAKVKFDKNFECVNNNLILKIPAGTLLPVVDLSGLQGGSDDAIRLPNDTLGIKTSTDFLLGNQLLFENYIVINENGEQFLDNKLIVFIQKVDGVHHYGRYLENFVCKQDGVPIDRNSFRFNIVQD